MTAHLFVYGTLLPDERGDVGAAERERLQQEGRIVGPGSTGGLMIDLGSYPGLVDGPGLVHGLVYHLPEASGTLAWLDAYEGVTGSAGDEYARMLRAVSFSSGAIILCWTYVFVQSMADRSLIMSGRWHLRRAGQAAC